MQYFYRDEFATFIVRTRILLRNSFCFIYSLVSTNPNIQQRQLQIHKYNISRRILTITDIPTTIEGHKMHIKHINEAHSYKNCYRRKSIIIKYFNCLFLALSIQHTKRILVRFYSIFSRYLIMVRFSKNKFERKMCFIFSTTFV